MRTVHVTWNTEMMAGWLDLGRGPKNPPVTIRMSGPDFQAYLPGLIGQEVLARVISDGRYEKSTEIRVHVRESGWTGPF